MNALINHLYHTFKFYNPYTRKTFFKKLNLEKFFFKKVVVFDSDEEIDNECWVNIQNKNNNSTTRNTGIGRAIRLISTHLDIDILDQNTKSN